MHTLFDQIAKDIHTTQCFLGTHHRIVTHCFLRGPLNSSFVLRSKIQITTPTKRKDIPVTHHIVGVNGLRKAQALEFNFENGATTTSLDSIYGCVKSTCFVLLVVIVMSPTTASSSYVHGRKWITVCINHLRAIVLNKTNE